MTDIKIELKEETYSVLDIEDVQENSWNPNVLDGVNFTKLKRALELAEGNHEQPILVRRKDDWNYEIIDWAHRHKAMKEIGFQEIVANIVSMTDKEARIATIQMNKFRGEFDSMQLAALLHELRFTFEVPELELTNVLWYSSEELRSLESFITFDPTQHIKAPKEDDDVKEETSEDEVLSEELVVMISQKSIYALESLRNSLWMETKDILYWLAVYRAKNNIVSVDVPSLETAKVEDKKLEEIPDDVMM